MKKLTILIVLLFPFVFLSCKKKETDHTSISDSKGDLLILVVSDSVECAMEYKKDDLPSANLQASPVTASAEFNSTNQNYDISIYAYGIAIYGTYSLIADVGWYTYVSDFAHFSEYNSTAFIDSIPGYALKRNQAYTIPLDTSKVDFVFAPYYTEELEPAWNKIKNLRMVFEYRKKYPDARIAFLCLKKANGETKSYFFMNKYKP